MLLEQKTDEGSKGSSDRKTRLKSREGHGIWKDVLRFFRYEGNGRVAKTVGKGDPGGCNELEGNFSGVPARGFPAHVTARFGSCVGQWR